MLKYTAEEAAKLANLKNGRHTNVHKQLLQLMPREALFIEKGKDWISKTSPNRSIDRLDKKQKMQFERGRDVNKKGWIAKCVK